MDKNSMGWNHEVHNAETLNQGHVYSLTLRASNGMTQQMVAYIPNEQVLKHYIDKAHKNGLQIEIKSISESN